MSLDYFPISVHPDLVEVWCHRTSTSPVRTKSGTENSEVISGQFLHAHHLRFALEDGLGDKLLAGGVGLHNGTSHVIAYILVVTGKSQ